VSAAWDFIPPVRDIRFALICKQVRFLAGSSLSRRQLPVEKARRHGDGHLADGFEPLGSTPEMTLPPLVAKTRAAVKTALTMEKNLQAFIGEAPMIAKQSLSATSQKTSPPITSPCCNRTVCPICGNASLRPFQPFITSLPKRFTRLLGRWMFDKPPASPILGAIVPLPVIRPCEDDMHGHEQGPEQAA
jgi:hypothetical protein